MKVVKKVVTTGNASPHVQACCNQSLELKWSQLQASQAVAQCNHLYTTTRTQTPLPSSLAISQGPFGAGQHTNTRTNCTCWALQLPAVNATCLCRLLRMCVGFSTEKRKRWRQGFIKRKIPQRDPPASQHFQTKLRMFVKYWPWCS